MKKLQAIIITQTCNDYLFLKWGTLKGYKFEDSPKALEALKEYEKIEESPTKKRNNNSFNDDTPRQKELLCAMIDGVNGEIHCWWGQEDLTKNRAKAKEYVMNHGKEK